MLTEEFNYTIDIWIYELERYDFASLCAKPSAFSWSLGQLYIHLINDTDFYIKQIKLCMSSNANAEEQASSGAKMMFLNNSFPDEIIEGAPANFYMQQADSKEQLMSCLKNLKNEMNKMAKQIANSRFKGKTKHPGLNYFNANEWLQFAEMHFRHHLRQKKRIDDFLELTNRQCN